MHPRKRNEEIERAKLKVLQFLGDPIIEEDGGAVREHIARGVRSNRMEGEHALRGVNIDKLLPRMMEEGLIGRAEVPMPHDGMSKPFFITEEGRRYLEAARKKAMSSEPGRRQDWAARETDPGVQETVADFIRRLAEFQALGEERIQEVSRGLAERLAQSPGLPR